MCLDDRLYSCDPPPGRCRGPCQSAARTLAAGRPAPGRSCSGRPDRRGPNAVGGVVSDGLYVLSEGRWYAETPAPPVPPMTQVLRLSGERYESVSYIAGQAEQRASGVFTAIGTTLETRPMCPGLEEPRKRGFTILADQLHIFETAEPVVWSLPSSPAELSMSRGRRELRAAAPSTRVRLSAPEPPLLRGVIDSRAAPVRRSRHRCVCGAATSKGENTGQWLRLRPREVPPRSRPAMAATCCSRSCPGLPSGGWAD